MSLKIPPDIERLVLSRVGADYPTPDDVLREAIRLLEVRDRQRQEKFEALKQDLQVAFDQIERGEVVDGPAAMEAIRRKVQRKMKERA